MGWLKRWRQARLQRDVRKVLGALRTLGGSQVSPLLIAELADVRIRRTAAALARLERTGRVTSAWADGLPRRRLYRVVSEVAE